MAKRSPLKVLLFLILLLVVAYLCKRGWEGFYATGDINIIEASYGLNCNGGNRGNITAKLQQLVNDQDNKSSFTFNGAVPYQHFNQVFGDPNRGCGKSVDVIYDCSDGIRREASLPGVNSETGTLRLSCPPPPPPPAAAAPAAACPACPACADLSQYMPKSSCNTCAAPKSCVDMTPYMLKAKCLLTDDDQNPPYMLIEDCICPTCKQHRQS